MDSIESGKLHTDRVKFFVLDEAGEPGGASLPPFPGVSASCQVTFFVLGEGVSLGVVSLPVSSPSPWVSGGWQVTFFVLGGAAEHLPLVPWPAWAGKHLFPCMDSIPGGEGRGEGAAQNRRQRCPTPAPPLHLPHYPPILAAQTRCPPTPTPHPPPHPHPPQTGCWTLATRRSS